MRPLPANHVVWPSDEDLALCQECVEQAREEPEAARKAAKARWKKKGKKRA